MRYSGCDRGRLMTDPKDLLRVVQTLVCFTIEPIVCAELGNVIVRWSVVESMLRDIVYDLTEIDPSVGRLVIRQPRAEEVASMIKDVLKQRGLKIKFEFASFQTLLSRIRGIRDQLAHGTFTTMPGGQLGVEHSSGNWDLGSFHEEKWSRRMKPTVQPVTVEYFRAVNLDLDSATKLTMTLAAQVQSALPPSPNRRPSQIVPPPQTPDETPKTPEGQP